MLGEAIGDLLPSAVAVTLSPAPIVAVILLLDTPRARANAPAFAAGWVAGLAAVSAIVVWVSGGADDTGGGTSNVVDVLKLLFGLFLLVVAAKQWRARPTAGHRSELPEWMRALDGFTAGRSARLGAVLSGVNPKNVALTFAAAASIAQAGLSAGGDAVALAVFVVIGSVSVAVPVVAYLLAGERVRQPLDTAKQFMADNSAVIMAVVCLVLAAKLLGDGIAGLSEH